MQLCKCIYFVYKDPYGLGGAYGQQTGGRQTSTGGSSQVIFLFSTDSNLSIG